MVTCLLFIAFSLIVRLYFAGVYEFSNLEGFLRRVAALRMDSVVVGVMTGWLYLNRKCFHRNQRMWFLIGLIGVIAMAYLRRQEEFNSIGAVQIVFYPLFSFFISLTMPFLYELPASSSEGFNRFFEATSKWSYSIYLSHVFFKDGMYLVACKLGLTNNLSIMLAMALVWLVIVYVVSALIYNKFELPFMRLLYQRQKNKKLMQAIK
jgi:peptidoglycan/LPS O-acetylase OafA/YrhL